MTAAGQLFELQTQGRLTNESESLSSPTLPTPRASEPGSTSAGYGDSLNDVTNRLVVGFARKDIEGKLLPTPKARDYSAEGYEAGLRRALPQLGTIVKGLADGDERILLPTPTIGHIRNYDEEIDDYLGRRQDYIDGKVKGMPGVSLGVAVRMELLKTPLADDHKNNGHNPNRIETLARQVWLTQKETNWGKFAAAIERWEKVIGRKAPAPTKPDGKDGSHRLSSLFTEWLMGLPEGHITGHNLSRAEELKMAGNGVVPQQAELALRFLIDDDNFK
jgi:DNA (cytosine-5)-methyltransferase 1